MTEAFGAIADTSALKDLAHDLAKVAPAAKRAAQVVLRKTAMEVVEGAKARASFSRYIPGTGKARLAGLNAKVSFGGPSAFWAAAIENRGVGDVTHPVFGNLNGQTSTNLNSRPAFLLPAFLPKVEEYVAEVGDAIVAATEAALHGA